MLLYNSATKKKEAFQTAEPGLCRMYTCGPTVYHYAHIGNLRSYIMEDVLERYLGYTGYEVKRVMNITDVGHLASDADTGEDKMLLGARRENKSVMDIARFYTDAFFADADKLNIKKPAVVAPATSCIDDFIKMIEVLLEKGFAYEAGGNVYFDTAKLDQYYIFNDFKEEDLAVGVRDGVDADANKRSQTDFALWFTKSKFDDQELKWPSPWGLGYPGWHIECSCIAMKFLGKTLDIHCGGIDNAFPHHTNEIAQSEAYTGKPWCRHWFHVHHLNTAGGKMSKSKGKTLTVSLLEEEGYDPIVYRFFCLQSHYRKTLLFSYDNLDNARAAYDKLIARIAQIDAHAEEADWNQADFDRYKQLFCSGLDNDLNTSMALTALYDSLKADISDNTKIKLVEDFDRVLGLDLLKHARTTERPSQPQGITEAEIREAIDRRAQAKKEKNYALADQIRNELLEAGVQLIDTPEGTDFQYK